MISTVFILYYIIIEIETEKSLLVKLILTDRYARIQLAVEGRMVPTSFVCLSQAASLRNLQHD